MSRRFTMTVHRDPAIHALGFALSFILAGVTGVLCHRLHPFSPSTKVISIPPLRKASSRRRLGVHVDDEKDDNDIDAIYFRAVTLEDGCNGISPNAVAALPLYEQAASRGHAGAHYRLARIFKDGRPGIDRDSPRAVRHNECAIELAEDVRAMHNLALILRHGAPGVPEDSDQARKLFERALSREPNVVTMCALAVLLEDCGDARGARIQYERAVEQGCTNAMYNLALLLRNGAPGVPRDVPAAVALYESAVKDGHAHAMFNLASLLWYGKGISRNPSRAMKLLEKAVEVEPDGDSLVALAGFLEEGASELPIDIPRAVLLYERALAVTPAPPVAMFRLGRLLREGIPDIPHDDVRGRALIRRAADAGYIPALELTGSELAASVGNDVTRGVQARRYLERAMHGGSIASMFALGRLLENGAAGVPCDAAEAVRLYERAAREGDHAAALNRLGQLLRVGAPPDVPADAVRAAAAFKKSIRDDRDADAVVHLADLLLVGAPGVKVDVGAASKMLRHAARKMGHVPAMRRLARVLFNGEAGVRRDVNGAIGLGELAVLRGGEAFDKMALARMLESPEAGELRDVARAQRLAREALEARQRT